MNQHKTLYTIVFALVAVTAIIGGVIYLLFFNDDSLDISGINGSNVNKTSVNANTNISNLNSNTNTVTDIVSPVTQPLKLALMDYTAATSSPGWYFVITNGAPSPDNCYTLAATTTDYKFGITQTQVHISGVKRKQTTPCIQAPEQGPEPASYSVNLTPMNLPEESRINIFVDNEVVSSTIINHSGDVYTMTETDITLHP